MGCTGNLSRETVPCECKSGYRNTTTATTMPRIKTATANRLTWFASHDSCTGTAFARKAGTNSYGVGAAESDNVPDDAPEDAPPDDVPDDASCSRCLVSCSI